RGRSVHDGSGRGRAAGGRRRHDARQGRGGTGSLGRGGGGGGGAGVHLLDAVRAGLFGPEGSGARGGGGDPVRGGGGGGAVGGDRSGTGGGTDTVLDGGVPFREHAAGSVFRPAEPRWTCRGVVMESGWAIERKWVRGRRWRRAADDHGVTRGHQNVCSRR